MRPVISPDPASREPYCNTARNQYQRVEYRQTNPRNYIRPGIRRQRAEIEITEQEIAEKRRFSRDDARHSPPSNAVTTSASDRQLTEFGVDLSILARNARGPEP